MTLAPRRLTSASLALWRSGGRRGGDEAVEDGGDAGGDGPGERAAAARAPEEGPPAAVVIELTRSGLGGGGPRRGLGGGHFGLHSLQLVYNIVIPAAVSR